MSYQYPDRITVEESVDMEVSPEFAIMEVVIEGESAVFGNEAFKKSKELAKFINDLEAIKYSSDLLTLENIAIKTASGKLLHSSSARFTIKLDKIPLELVAKLVALIASQKNIEIKTLNYDFGDLSDQKSQLLQKACTAAKNQGSQLCSTLGMPMLGVYTLSPKWDYPDNDAFHQKYAAAGMFLERTRSAAGSEMEGMNFTANYKGKLRLLLKIEFRVGEFD